MNNQDNHHKTDTVSFRQCLKGQTTDYALLFLLLAATLLLWLEVNKQLNTGPITAYVYHQKQLLAKYPLPADDKVIHVSAMGELGESEIEISKQGIRMLSSPCTTHHCTLSGQKSYTGSVIACVPNHIMVVIRGSDRDEKQRLSFDAISE